MTRVERNKKKSLKQKHLLLAVVSAVVVTIGLNHFASAGDAKWYPGVGCKYYGTQSSDNYFSPIGLQANGLKNTSSSTRVAVCPIVRSTFDSEVEWAEMRTVGDATCYMFVRPIKGGSARIYAAGDKESLSSGVKRHIWAKGSSDIPVNDKETMTFYCAVPSNTTINAYKVTES